MADTVENTNTRLNSIKKCRLRTNYAIRKALNLPLVNLVVRNVIKTVKCIVNKLSDKIRISGVTTINLHGLSYKIYSKGDDMVHTRIFYDSSYTETDEIIFVSKLAPYLDVIIDVGANVGIFAIVSGLSNRNLQCICFEPHRPNAQRLEKNLRLNNLHERVTVVHGAVGDKTGKIEITVPSVDDIIDTASVNANWAKNFYSHKYQYTSLEVDLVSIDDYIKTHNIGRVDFIKIDVETYEHAVLMGARKTIARFRPVVMCEIFYFVSTIRQIERFFHEMEYTFWAIGSRMMMQVENIRSIPEGKNYVFLPFEFSSCEKHDNYNAILFNEKCISSLGTAVRNRKSNFSP
ncbi:MAG: FkbM family methyltransferase [Bacteroidia bacterium]|nr:FkbM family methyltransferase [Bacteroidia bacterium]MDW8332633.1 FkbM family methyltransferase [Bacteroidia bacterium]